MLYAVLAVIWILASGALLTLHVDDPVVQQRLELGKGLLFVLVTSVLLYFILCAWRRHDSATAIRESPVSLRLSWRLLACAILLGTVPLAGVLVVRIYTPHVEREAFSNLEAIADLKVSQLTRWLDERYNDGEVIMAVPGFAESVAAMHRPGAGREGGEPVRNRLTVLAAGLRYEAAALLDTAGRQLVEFGSCRVREEDRALLPQALASGLTQFGGIVGEEAGERYFDLLVPLHLVTDGKRQAVGVVILRDRPGRFLFPFLQHWPTASASGETLLLRHGRESVSFLNEPRGGGAISRSGGASGLFAHLTRDAAESGWTAKGEDFRQIMTLAAFRPVPGTDWILAAKVDRAEVMAPLHDLALWVGVLTLLTIFVVGGVVLAFWQQRTRMHRLEMFAQSHRLMQQFYDLPFIGISITSPETGRWVGCNDRFCEIMGYAREELLHLSWQDLTHPEDMAVSKLENGRVQRGESDGFRLDKRFIRKDGTVVYANVDVRCVRREDGAPEYILAMFQDITARKADEARIQRLTQVYAALSECNQAIARCTREEELFPRVCHIAVAHGGMKMAWIGRVDAQTQMVRLVASHGEGTGWMDGVQVSASATSPLGGGQTGTAIRERRPVWIGDFQHDPMTAPWHDLGARAGWVSSVALPLLCNEQVVGALMLYSATPEAFDQAVRDLVVEMAKDLSHALTAMSRERGRQSMEAQLRLMAKVFEQGGEGIVITDARGDIVMVNRAFENVTGYTQAEVSGRNPRLLSSGRHDREFFRHMWETITSEGFWQGEIWNRRKDGDIYPEYLSVSRIVDGAGQVTHYIATFNDISENKANQEHIQRLAHYDSLTGLPNRILLADRVALALSHMERAGGQLALIFLDLDRFKNVNDSLGHRIGDELLVQVGARLRGLLRDEDTVSRLGGNEFILLLPGADADGAAHVAEKVLKTLSSPYHIEQHELAITPSMGIAMATADGATYEALSMCADTAMYRAKQGGRQTYRFFTREMQERSDRTLQLENALRRALELNQLCLHYQPQMSLENGRIIGVEALLRWRHPELGDVSPADFIPVAEDSGMILPIGEWVLRTAIWQMKAWLDTGLPPLVMAVNLSAIQFRQARLPELVSQILAESGLPADQLELELTEGVAMENPLEAIEIMNDLHARGIRMSIDDFGTGYSSLNYLKRFKIYKLKIDQSFVRDISRDPEDEAIVGAIISLAQSLGMQTIAEGVETEAQAAFLRAGGCREGQGYLYSRPLPAEEFERFVRIASGNSC